MSQENVDLVRSLHEAWLAGGAVEHLIAEDLEYVNPPDAVESGTRRGREALAAVREVYPDFRSEPERYIDAGGDDVVVIATAQGTGASGVAVKFRLGYIWTVENGQAIRLRWFSNPDDALVAAGLSE